MKTVAIVEARMTSTRLPGKVLMSLGDKPMLEVLIERICKSKHLDEIVIATTTNATDDPIAKLCEKIGTNVYRGSEQDVLSRVLEAAQSVDADYICELMGDSPFLDPTLIDTAIETHLSSGNDYTSNFYPENHLPMGFAVQVYATETLRKASALTTDPIDRSHVTYYIYQHPEIFTCGGVPIPQVLQRPEVRLCVDEKNDFDLVTKVYVGLVSTNIAASCEDILAYLDRYPGLLELNKDVKQKDANEG